ncbi:MAG: hypothetical protein N2169_07675 [bacterium]|nr:hypothetical protein [bacterium]
MKNYDHNKTNILEACGFNSQEALDVVDRILLIPILFREKKLDKNIRDIVEDFENYLNEIRDEVGDYFERYISIILFVMTNDIKRVSIIETIKSNLNTNN